MSEQDRTEQEFAEQLRAERVRKFAEPGGLSYAFGALEVLVEMFLDEEISKEHLRRRFNHLQAELKAAGR
jgi:hypothetical protein